MYTGSASQFSNSQASSVLAFQGDPPASDTSWIISRHVELVLKKGMPPESALVTSYSGRKDLLRVCSPVLFDGVKGPIQLGAETAIRPWGVALPSCQCKQHVVRWSVVNELCGERGKTAGKLFRCSACDMTKRVTRPAWVRFCDPLWVSPFPTPDVWE